MKKNNITPEEVKDFILNVLKGTQAPNDYRKEISLKEDMFLSKIFNQKYDTDYVKEILQKLIELKYIRKWNNGSDGMVYALDGEGLLKSKEGGFAQDKKSTKEIKLMILGAFIGALVTKVIEWIF